MQISTLIAQQEDIISTRQADINRILATVKAQKRDNLTELESIRSDALFSEIETARAKLESYRQVASEEADYLTRAHQTTPTNLPNRQHRTATVHVGSEARVYNESSDPNGTLFLADIARDFLNGGHDRSGASERLERHAAEERVERPGYSERALSGAGTGAFSGLTVPQYLVDMVAPATANLRPLADVSNRHQLPADGMSLNVSRITTSSSAALQATEFATVSGTDMDDTLLSVPVQTAAGSQLLSRQAVERGSGIEETALADMLRQVNTTLDSTMINQATTGLLACSQSVAYTSATPSSQELWPILYKAESVLEKAVLGVARVDYAVMRTDRFNWLVSQVGTTFPFFGAANTGVGQMQSGVQLTNDYTSPVRAVLSNGLRVVCDNNIPQNVNSNQDVVLLLASGECHLWEDSAVVVRAEQPSAGALGVLIVAYQYFAYTAQRYANNPARITGTGLVTQAGF